MKKPRGDAPGLFCWDVDAEADDLAGVQILRRRQSEGDVPIIFLNARLKAASDA